MDSSQSHELERRLKQLEAATSRKPTLTSGVDREAAELRESWDVFAECLTAADAAWDERRLVDTLAREEHLARRSVRWSFTLALSLSLLVLGACVWLDRLAFRDVDMLTHNQPSRAMASSRAGATDHRPADAANLGSTEHAWDWNDDLDEQLVEASETLVAIRADWYPADRVDLLSRRLEELRTEWEDESL